MALYSFKFPSRTSLIVPVSTVKKQSPILSLFSSKKFPLKWHTLNVLLKQWTINSSGIQNCMSFSWTLKKTRGTTGYIAWESVNEGLHWGIWVVIELQFRLSIIDWLYELTVPLKFLLHVFVLEIELAELVDFLLVVPRDIHFCFSDRLSTFRTLEGAYLVFSPSFQA